MLDVLERAGLMENAMKFKNDNLEFTLDKTNVKITGIYGLRMGLDREFYKKLDKEKLANEKGFKIFMFHAALDEFLPEEGLFHGQSYTDLPKNFNYYAGGHVHMINHIFKENYGLIAYPGPLFPNSFKEMEELNHGGFYIVDDHLKITRINIKLKDVKSYFINAQDKTINEIEDELKKINDVNDKIILIRIEGTLKSGKPSDINLNEIFNKLNAYIVLKNTAKFKSIEFSDLENNYDDVNQVELDLIRKNLSKLKLDFDEEKITKQLMITSNLEKDEGERNIDFESRLINDLNKIFSLEDVN